MSELANLHELIGRLLVARIPGTKLDKDAKKLLKSGTIGGAVLFKENASDLAQLHELCCAVVKNSLHVPVLTADQEGGAIQRFEHVITSIPSPMALAACAESNALVNMTKLSASQLKKLGINCMLSPVLDVLTNQLNPIIGTRAFSDNPRMVAELGAKVADAITEEGLIPVGKHFPGHGFTLQDSHTGLAENGRDSKTLWQIDLLPFRNILEKLPSIMVGHVWLSSIDPEPLPATLSPNVIKNILRNYLAYDGLIVSDDMIMKAITDRWGLAEACIMSLNAGIDLLLVCGDLEQTVDVHSHIVEAVKQGRIAESTILDATRRIEKLFSTRQQVISKKELEEFATRLPVQRDHALKVSCEAITILRGEIPAIDSGDWLVITPNHPRYPMRLKEHLSEIAKERFASLTFSELRYSLNPSPEESLAILKECRERNCIYLTYRSLNNQGQLHLGSLIAAEARQRIAVSTDTPFDLLGLPAWENIGATYDPSDLAIEALAKVLLKEVRPQGVCPVSLELQVARQAIS